MKTLMIATLLLLLAGCASEPQLTPYGKSFPARDGGPCVADKASRFRVTGSRISRPPGSPGSYSCKSYGSIESKERIIRIFTPAGSGIAN